MAFATEDWCPRSDCLDLLERTAAMTQTIAKPLLQSTLTCPECGVAKVETMPTNACQYLYECTACRKLLKPKKGDCCVFCSYGTVPCPPVQATDSSCCNPKLAN